MMSKGYANELRQILNYLNKKRSFDAFGFRIAMLERRVRLRLVSTNCKNYTDYFLYLQNNSAELDHLINTLTINVSRFFRNTLTFEYIADQILPDMVHQKTKTKDQFLRIWSAGCAMGEEPYSVAILINELLKKKPNKLMVNIFATDIDAKILTKAQEATYQFESIGNVKYRLLKKYFSLQEESFQLTPEIRDRVSFSFYDMLDKNSYAPPESIFGAFDMVFCRNVLIYFDIEHQELIYEKLYRALAENGYLILGKSEIPTLKYKKHFKKVVNRRHIYQKVL